MNVFCNYFLEYRRQSLEVTWYNKMLGDTLWQFTAFPPGRNSPGIAPWQCGRAPMTPSCTSPPLTTCGRNNRNGAQGRSVPPSCVNPTDRCVIHGETSHAKTLQFCSIGLHCYQVLLPPLKYHSLINLTYPYYGYLWLKFKSVKQVNNTCTF